MENFDIKAFLENIWAEIVAFIQSIWDREVGDSVKGELEDAWGNITDIA